MDQRSPARPLPLLALAAYSFVAAVVSLAAVSLGACGTADAPPLGGPFGGTSGAADPTQNLAAGLTAREYPDAGPPDTGYYVRTGPPPTFSQLFDLYMGPSSPGGPCSQCHGALTSASATYVWLQGERQVGGASTSPAIIDPSQSCMSYFGGSMPPGGPTHVLAATADFVAWAQAGGKND